MKIKDKVLIVEDEQSISNFISMVLNANGYDTIIVGSGEEALTMIASHCPDLIVLDLGLPDMDGMEVLKSVRKWSNLPVVVVSARNHEHDKVEALDYGADDYLVKPYELDELSARVRALLRRSAGRADPIIERGALRISPATREVTFNGEPVILSSKEYALLAALAERQGVVWSRSQLEEKLYNWDNTVGSNAIEVHIHHLRKKLSDNAIKTVRGVGYLLET